MAQSNIISGSIYDQHNRPLPNHIVEVYDQDLRQSQLLGATETNAAGKYQLEFDNKKAQRADVKTIDVFIVVKKPRGRKELGRSKVHFNIPNEYVLDFKIDGSDYLGPPEFDRLVRIVEPLLVGQRVKIHQLKEDDTHQDFSFLSAETGEPKERIELLPIAYQFGIKAKLDPDIFYGLFRMSFPQTWDTLFLVKRESIKEGLESAISENIISSKFSSQISKILKHFDALSASLVLKGESLERKDFQKVFATAIPQEKDQKTVVDLWLKFEDEPENFWKQLEKTPGFKNGKKIKSLQHSLHLNALTLKQPALTNLLVKEGEKDQDLKEVRGFAKFEAIDWEKRIDKLVTDGSIKTFPDGIKGDSPEEKITHYAETLTRFYKELFPTSVFSSKMEKDRKVVFEPTVKNDLKIFLSNNPDFNLETTRIKQDFGEANIKSIRDKDKLLSELQSINRLYKLSPNYDHIAHVRKAKLLSSSDIVRHHTERSFVKEFEHSIGADEAKVIFNRAAEVDKKATAIALNYKMSRDVPVFAMSAMENGTVNLQSTFGDNQLCQCNHCQSLYSPAAYFVDLLHFLHRKDKNAYIHLVGGKIDETDDNEVPVKGRRPDLLHILLTCKNTNTPLPYIDLVNELLEEHIAPSGVDSYQTTFEANQLAAYPENTNDPAYDLLKDPVNTPLEAFLNLPYEETHSYLQALGIARHHLMSLYYGNKGDVDANVHFAAEILGLTPEDLGLLYGSIKGSDAPITLVKDFLSETGLSYRDMLQLLECRFINPVDDQGNKAISIVSPNNDDDDDVILETCDLDVLEFSVPISLNKKVFRFIRLWKKLGWNMYDVDRTLRAIDFSAFPDTVDATSTETVNTELILPLSHVVRLKTEFGIAIPKLLSLWHHIDHINYVDHHKDNQPEIPSIFKRLFQNKKNAIEISQVEFDNEPPINENYRSKIIALLNLTHDESQLVTGSVSIENISSIYRKALFSRVLLKSVLEIQKLQQLSNLNTFAGPRDYLAFIETIKLIEPFGISILQLFAVLIESDSKDVPDIYENLIDPNKELRLYNLLRNEIQVLIENAATENVKKDTLLLHLSEDFAIDLDYLKNSLTDVNLVLNGALNDFISNFLDDTEFDKSVEELLTTNNEVHISYSKFSKCWHRLKIIMRQANISFEEFLYFEGNSSLGINDLWKIPGINDNAFDSYINLLKLVTFRDSLKNKSDDWYLIFDDKIENVNVTKSKFNELLANQAKIEISELENLLGTTDTGILGYTFAEYHYSAQILNEILDCVYASHTYDTSVKVLHSLTVDELTSNEALVAKNLLKSKYEEPAWLEVIKPISNAIRERKRDALVAYILHAQGQEQFRIDNSILNVNDLYAYFLIDLEMSSCMISSRIKQAISSVQLFIDRCLLGIEENVELDNDFANQWNTWRKQYRVWEANRKIFLYPENWIEPELRDDKSPFFTELESKLMQNDMTNELAEEALREYLEKLDEVSNLEIMGLFPEKRVIDGQTKKDDYLHVIGRTKNSPHIYYYRKQLPTKNWTAWERIDLDIEGDHILPVVWNGRVFLFWGIFEEKEKRSENKEIMKLDSNSGDISSKNQAQKYLELDLNVSEFKNNSWGKKNSFTKKIILNLNDLGTRQFSKEQVSLVSKVNDHDCLIKILVPFRSDGSVENLDEMELLDYNREILRLKYCNGKVEILNTDDINEYELLIKSPNLKREFSKFVKGRENQFDLFKYGVVSPFVNGDVEKQTLFDNTSGIFEITIPRNNIENIPMKYFFFQDSKISLFGYKTKRYFSKIPFPLDIDLVIRPVVLITNNSVPNNMNMISGFESFPANSLGNNIFDNSKVLSPPEKKLSKEYKYAFTTFYHPFVCSYIETLSVLDVERLYSSELQNPGSKPILTANEYKPTQHVVTFPRPYEKLDFDFIGTYALYNWELFFHIPLLIATRLNANQKFEEARKWFHFIFDPTTTSSEKDAKKYWKPIPFRNEIKNKIKSIDEILQDETELESQVNYWEQNPFNPHAVARLRVAAYMRTTFMKYIDNLIDWADQLFRRDSLESINEAIQLYILAANLLGEKPEVIPQRAKPIEQSYKSLVESNFGLDRFSNTIAEIENYITPNESADSDGPVYIPYFCTPKNESLLKYWERISDRLFKIRNCMNIEGQVRQLALFEPPIDPALLVRARAAGLDINTVLDEMDTSLPHYRFQMVLQKANDLCNDLKQLGAGLLSALEKKDVEELSLLRSTQELQMLDLIKDIRTKQRDEAKENLEALLASRDTVEERKTYNESREFMNAGEIIQFQSNNFGLLLQHAKASADGVTNAVAQVPDFKIGSGFTLGSTYGGSNLSKAAKAYSDQLGAMSLINNLIGNISGTLGSYHRRMDDWKFQAKTAELELKQMDKQITAAEIRLSIAEKELENHEQQIENTQQVDEYLRSKYTNMELYSYMVSQISGIYFQSYQLAYDLARKAEKCFQFELDVDSSDIIKFGYWDSLKKGLLSGEKLQYDLRRLDIAYLDNNKRRYEITKHISLKRLNPEALLNLKATGKINDLVIPEWLFDLDCPGHYKRQIKTVSLSIPCISGPYTSVNCKIELVSGQIRKNPSTENQDNLIDRASNIKSIVTSSGQNDNGMFEGNLRDERYLPFEGSGIANSKWNLELPELKQFDYNTITDVILHVSYTALYGGESFKNDIINLYKTELSNDDNLYRLLSLKHDFPNEWNKFIADDNTDDFIVELNDEHFPYFTQSSNIQIASKELFQIDDGNLVANLNDKIEDNDEMKILVKHGLSDLPTFVIVNYKI